MKLIHKVCALAVVSACALVPATLFAAELSTKNEPRLVLNAGKKWSTDEAVRRGMDSIREQLGAMRASAGLAPMRDEYYAMLGDSIKREVGEILVASRLEPSAVANLHVVVNQLVVAADTLEGRTGAQRASGLDHADLVLAQCARFFDHPGWQSRA